MMGESKTLSPSTCLAWPNKIRTEGCAAIGPGHRRCRGQAGEGQCCEVEGVGAWRNWDRDGRKHVA
jgi:hypothetical protein